MWQSNGQPNGSVQPTAAGMEDDRRRRRDGTLTADGLLANLAKEVAQARTLRWISSDASAQHITERLQAARAAISRKQLDSSASILNELRKEVAAQSGKALTSEAAALVDVNIQYAVRRTAKP